MERAANNIKTFSLADAHEMKEDEILPELV
jgi:hypothetical protein